MPLQHGKRPTATAWKRYRCVGCGGTYRVKVECEGVLESFAKQELEKALATDEKASPCPSCGCAHPAAVGYGKSQSHLGITALFMLLAIVLLFVGLVPRHWWLPPWLGSLILGTAGALWLIRHTRIVRRDPNRDTAANRASVQPHLASGQVVAEAPETELGDRRPRTHGRAAIPMLVLGAIAVVTMLAPFALRTAYGVPTLSGAKHDLAGLGGSSRVTYPEEMHVLNGYWEGEATATVTEDGGTGLTQVPATSQKYDADERQRRTPSGNRATSAYTTVWAEVQFPNDPALNGKTVEVRVDTQFGTYGVNSGRFAGAGESRSTTARFILVPNAVGVGYSWSYWIVFGGAVLFLVSGAGLMRSAKALANDAPPATILPADAPKDEDGPPPDTDTPRASDRPGRL